MTTTWNDHARQILIDHIDHPEPFPGDPLTNITHCIATAAHHINYYINGRTTTNLLEHIVTHELGYAARTAKQQLETINMWSVERLLDLLVYKQTKYGHGNILRFGMVGVGIRASDKAERLKNLAGQNQGDMRDETIIDTYDDLIGYAVIAKMLTDNTFTTELDPT